MLPTHLLNSCTPYPPSDATNAVQPDSTTADAISITPRGTPPAPMCGNTCKITGSERFVIVMDQIMLTLLKLEDRT